MILTASRDAPWYRRVLGRCYRRHYGRWPFTARRTTVRVGGIHYELDLSQLIDNYLFFEGCWEEEVASCLSRYARDGMTVLDVGANVGAHTFRLARAVGSDGRVVAFEPMRWARRKLERNQELNAFGNITIEAIALSDSQGEEELRFRSNWPLDGKHQPEANVVERIAFETLDRYSERHGLSVDLIKLDVDGFEARVLRGGIGVLRSCRPVLVMEVDLNASDGLLDLLGDEGYWPHDPASGERIPDLLDRLGGLPGGHCSLNVAFLPQA